MATSYVGYTSNANNAALDDIVSDAATAQAAADAAQSSANTGITNAATASASATAAQATANSAFNAANNAGANATTAGTTAASAFNAANNAQTTATSAFSAANNAANNATTRGPLSADTIPTSPNAADDEFEGAALDTGGTRRAGATPWAWMNQGGASAAVGQGNILLSFPGNASNNLRGVLQATAGSTWKYRCKLTAHNGGASALHQLGMMVRNSGSGRIVSHTRGFRTSSQQLVNERWTNFTTFSANIQGTDIFTPGSLARSAKQPIYLEIEQTALNLVMRYSDNGVDGSFIDFLTEALATFIVSVDQIGLLGYDGNANNAHWAAFDWFRKVA